MKTAAAIITESRATEQPRFLGIKTPRVSMIGYCDRRHVAKVLGIITSDISDFYCRSGYMLQDAVYNELKKVYPGTVQEVTVATTVEGGETHPDLFIPEIKHGVQVKSDAENASFGKPKKAHQEQALLEWHFWRLSGQCVTEEGLPIAMVPNTYELLYVGRESFGLNIISVPIKYDPVKARALQDRYENIMDYIEMEVLTEPLVQHEWQCGYCSMRCFE